jgi:dihydropteroate synthase
MGVLNVTPDSFSDGDEYSRADAAIDRAAAMIREGAAIVDVGPESTRPEAEPVPPDEQIRRAVPVIERVRSRFADVCLSIDTSSSAVARAALEAGADWINDVTALRGDARMAALAADTGAPVVLMHMQGTPRNMQHDPHYDDVVSEIAAFLAARVENAVAAGISRDRLVIDPGIGFGKTVEHNVEILRRLGQIAALGPPVMVGASRKSFLSPVVGGASPRDRLGGSIACAAVAVLAGGRIIRGHDVRETVQAVRLCNAIRGYSATEIGTALAADPGAPSG